MLTLSMSFNWFRLRLSRLRWAPRRRRHPSLPTTAHLRRDLNLTPPDRPAHWRDLVL